MAKFGTTKLELGNLTALALSKTITLNTSDTYIVDGVNYAWNGKSFSVISPTPGGRLDFSGLDNPDGKDAVFSVWAFKGDGISQLSGTVVALGDSRLDSGQTLTFEVARTWISHLQYMLNGRITLIYNAGKGGDNSAGMLARFENDVAAYSPEWCFFMAPINDVSSAQFPIQTTISNITAIYAKCVANNIKFATATMGPWSLANTTVMKGKIATYNRWLINWCAYNSIPCADEYGVMANPVDGTPAVSTYTYDGGHYSDHGSSVVANAWYKVLDPILPNKVVGGVSNPLDLTNLTYDTNSAWPIAGTLPAGWSLQGTATTKTGSVVARPDGLPGSVLQVTGTAGAQGQYMGVQSPGFVYSDNRANSTLYNVGNRINALDGNQYICTISGTTAASPPTFNKELGETTVDGGATFIRVVNFKAGDKVVFETEVFTTGVSGGGLGFMPAVFGINIGTTDGFRIRVQTDGATKVPPPIVSSGVLRSKPITLTAGSGNGYYFLMVAYMDNGVTGTVQFGRMAIRHFDSIART